MRKRQPTPIEAYMESTGEGERRPMQALYNACLKHPFSEVNFAVGNADSAEFWATDILLLRKRHPGNDLHIGYEHGRWPRWQFKEVLGWELCVCFLANTGVYATEEWSELRARVLSYGDQLGPTAVEALMTYLHIGDLQKGFELDCAVGFMRALAEDLDDA